MSERVELSDLTGGIRRRAWIPVLCALVGAMVGVIAAMSVPPVYRSQATVLVGPTNGAVTHSATIRTSENLAIFYADMARRQLVLEPVVRELRLGRPWGVLRNQVSAVVPPQNLRLVTVTVMGEDQQETDDIANALVSRLVSLSPNLSSGNKQEFINDQADELKVLIVTAQSRIQNLESEIEVSTDPVALETMEGQLRRDQRLVRDWQRNYVELIAAEPSSDAGGLQIIDEATAVTDMGRSGMYRQAVVGGFVGGVIGLVIAWVLHSREGRRRRRRSRPGPVTATTAVPGRGSREPWDEESGDRHGDGDVGTLAGSGRRHSTGRQI